MRPLFCTMLTVYLIGLCNIIKLLEAEELDQTPIVGKKSTKCYDDFNRPQRCIPEFENAAFNLLMEATNTCGENGETEFCVQSGVTGIRKSCDICQPGDHHPRYLTDFHNQDRPTWWQSDTIYEAIQYPNQVNLTLKLGKAFDITYVRLVFFSPRPESFSIYKKTADNSSWVPYQYYSATCRDTYNLPDTEHTRRGEETRALCTSEYSDISPLREGNVAFSTLQGRPSAYNFEASEELQEWVTATEIMITLDRLNTFGDEVFGDPQVLKSYFYAIADVAVGARCKCNGHASECITSTGLGGSRRRVCRCEHNTAGPDCNECLPFYNDAPWGRATARNTNECKQCNCNGYSNRCYYDEQLYQATGHGGHCIDCTANRDGANCERCRANYFMRQDGFCVACNCDTVGSRNLQCNIEGKCQCKSGVTGDKCDKCAINHYDFGPQGCKNCGCSEEGSLNNEPHCDEKTGVCYCKANVEGKRCRECKPGFFSLDRENKFGCTPCFCYGHSSECGSALGYSAYQLESAFAKSSERWRASDEYNRPTELQYNAIEQAIGVEAKGQEAVYFLAPERYLGDQRTSYNHYLQFRLKIVGNRAIPSAVDLILEGSNARVTNTIFAQDNELPSHNMQTYRFLLNENPEFGWQPRLSERAFMSILTNLTAIRIKGTYTAQGVGLLDDFILETASRGVAGPPALWVEQCKCPLGYVGQHCESCAPGYRHSPSLGGPFMPCVPCDCNKHADICESETGRCICHHNTAGDNCELCARGFYGNALGGSPVDCAPCNCPNGGACVQVDEEVVMCTECPMGYTGHKCDSCTDGYFGDPTGLFGPAQKCMQCECNLNIDPNGIGNCNTTTGECLRCIHNTIGPRCEECRPGYYGNALALPKGDCKPCQCYEPGTRQSDKDRAICDRVTGACLCKDHVIGKNCDKCEDGYFDLGNDAGCQPCNCDPTGSYNNTCDERSGQCFCRTGVVGLRCSHCETHKYGFSTNGCKDCDCDRIGSRDLQCDANGQCPCLENVEGRRCDRCKENKFDRQRGCVNCPHCYNLVQNASRQHQAKLAKLSEILDDIDKHPTVIDDENFSNELYKLQQEVNDFHKMLETSTGDANIMQQMEEIERKSKEISQALLQIEKNVHLTRDKLASSQEKIGHTNDIVNEAEGKLAEVIENLETQGKQALENAWKRAKVVGQQSDKMTEISHEARFLANKIESETDEIVNSATEAKNKSIEAYDLSKESNLEQKNVSDIARQLQTELAQTEIRLNKTQDWASDVSNKSKNVKAETLALLNTLNNIVIPELDVASLKQRARDLKAEAQQIYNETDEILLKNDELLADIQEQFFLGQEILERGTEQQDEATDLLSEIHLSKTQAEGAIKQGDLILLNTKDTFKILNDFDRQVHESKQLAEDALGNKDEIHAIIVDSKTKTAEAFKVLYSAKTNAQLALEKALEADQLARNASVNAENIKNSAVFLFQNTTSLGNEAELMAGRVSNTEGEYKMLYEQTKSNNTLINQSKEKVGRAGKDTQEASKKVSDLLADVEEVISELQNLPVIDEKQLDRLEQELKLAEDRVAEARLEERLLELQKKQKQQTDLADFYQKQIYRLQQEVSNIEQISKSLPDGCFKRVELEP